MIPGLERSPGEGNGNPIQYSCLENSIVRGAWEARVCGVEKSQTQLTNTHTHTQITPGDFDPRVPVTMFERLDMNTLTFPTRCVLIDYLEGGMHCNCLRRNFCISCKTVVFMMLVNISYGSFI